MVTGDDMEVRKYKRLTSLTVLNKAVGKILPLLFLKQTVCIAWLSWFDVGLALIDGWAESK